ncbi:transposase [uncultured Holdemanella sp.]|uniref:transposase n=1 Tax=uncultured Holdemanella sp. TaxID=1763549 RepID=UPI0025DD5B74|nr:transposase [uncultured Holdemanella sp.]
MEKEYYARLSNGPMESFNRKPKDLKRDSRGFSDFNYTRNRILWLQVKKDLSFITITEILLIIKNKSRNL